MKLAETDICVILPASFATGEPGDPLSNQVLAVIRAMAEIGYGPVDFGEGNDNSIELWFINCITKVVAQAMADQFNIGGGNV